MTVIKTPNDILSSKLSDLYRKLSDLNIKILGTETSVLRITKSTPDVLGDFTETVSSQIINNVIIKYPTADIKLVNSTNSTTGAKTDAMDLWELLPIKLILPYYTNFEYTTNPIALMEDDIIVHVLIDENNNKIPITMYVTLPKGVLFNRHLVKKVYDLTLYRGDTTSAMQTIITTYVNSFVV
jgi:hypothetical protein